MSVAAVQTVKPELVRVYVWDLPVRITHWLIALSILVLAITGYYIGNPFIIAPDPATQEYVMGTVRAIHSFTAIAFTLSALSRVLWMFMGNHYARWHQLFPVDRKRRRQLLPWLKFYLFARPETPNFVGHNPLAGVSYLVVYLLCLMAAITGYALFGMSSDLWLMEGFAKLLPLLGGPQTARWIHHVIMWLLILFIVHHIACAVLVARVSQNAAIDSMFSGFRFVKPERLAEVAEERSSG